MAQKVFKGFKQEVEGQFTAETGYIYFVRKEANTGATDGYLLFNGKNYGTSVDAINSLEELIGELPSGFSSISEWIESNELVTAGALTNLDERVSANTADIAAISGVTGDFATNEALGIVSGRVDALEAISAGTRLDVLEASAATKEEVGTLSGRVDALEAISADTRLTELETSAATKEALGTLSGRVDAIEEDYLTSDSITALTADVEALSAVSADSRIAALEAISGQSHTHDNKNVLDGISAEDVTAWNNAEANASAYTDSKYDSAVTASQVVLSALTGESATSGYLKSYEIYQGGSSLGKIDIPKDLVVSSGEVVTVEGIKYLRLYIANDPEHPVDIAVSDLAHVYTEGTGITISNDDKISAKVVDANGLYADSDGIKVRLATADSAGTMSAADFVKLGTIEASAQTNVIEEIKVDGTALIVTDKAVDIILSGYATNETVGTLSGRVDTLSGAVSANTEFITNSAATKEEVGTLSGRVDTLSGAVSANTEFITNSAATKEEVGTLSGRVDALSAISADTRLTVLEASALTADDLTAITANIEALSAVSADTRLDVLEASAATKTEVGTLSGRVDELELSAHTHDNKDVLDTITSADTESWDAALQQVSGSSTVSVTAKADGVQTLSVNVSEVTGNTISVEDDGLFAAIYYDGNDSDVS